MKPKFVVAGALAATMALSLCGCKTSVGEISEGDEPVETAPGSPLDAVAYEAPAFAEPGYHAYRVTDRQSGESWWLVCMGNEGEKRSAVWVALPIEGDGDV